MKNTVRNTFQEGLVTDIHPSTSKPSTIVDALNVQFTTRNDNQIILQKADGVEEVVDGYPDTLIPLAAKEYDDVLYIVGYDETHNLTEVGTYPSVDYDSPTGIDVNKDQLAYTSNLRNTWHDGLPDQLVIQLNNSNTFNIVNTMITAASVSVLSTTGIVQSYFTIEPGGSVLVYILSGTYSGQVGEVRVVLTGLPEFGIADQVLAEDTFYTITTSSVPLPALEDTITINPTNIIGTAPTDIIITNNSGRPVEVEIQAEPGISFSPNVPPNEFVIADGETSNRALLQLDDAVDVTKTAYIVIKDSYGNTMYKMITLKPQL